VLEGWSNGVLECWSNGVLEYWSPFAVLRDCRTREFSFLRGTLRRKRDPQHSNTPSLQYSNTPTLQYSASFRTHRKPPSINRNRTEADSFRFH
jgi:hypothetical protein